jgi:osmotically-inducible protein OsmY
MSDEATGHHEALEPSLNPSSAEVVQDDITHSLGHSWFFDPHTLEVHFDGGRITLTGTVRSQRERRMAAAAAWAHEGVTDVDNQLTLA